MHARAHGGAAGAHPLRRESRTGTAARAVWAEKGVEVVEVPEGDNGDGVDLPSVLAVLGERGVIQLMVEGGGAVLGTFLAAPGLAQQLRLYVGATALGSTAARWMQSSLARTIGEAPRWKLLEMTKLGDDACLDYALDVEADNAQVS